MFADDVIALALRNPQLRPGVGFLAHVSGLTIGGMSEAKNPQDKRGRP
jgi:hypothetical protein